MMGEVWTRERCIEERLVCKYRWGGALFMVLLKDVLVGSYNITLFTRADFFAADPEQKT